MLRQPTERARHRLALTAEVVAATVTATLVVALAIQHDTVLASIFAVGSASFVVDAIRRILRSSGARTN